MSNTSLCQTLLLTYTCSFLPCRDAVVKLKTICSLYFKNATLESLNIVSFYLLYFYTAAQVNLHSSLNIVLQCHHRLSFSHFMLPGAA